jgi:hypothetical protein
MDEFEQRARRAGAELRVSPPDAAISRIEQGRRRHSQRVGVGAALATIAVFATGFALWPRPGKLSVQTPPTTAAPTSTTNAATSTTAGLDPLPPSTLAPPTSTSPATTTASTAPNAGSSIPSRGPGTPSRIVWSRTTVPPGPYNGTVRSDGYGLTSLNPTTPRIVWLSTDGTTWEQRDLPSGFNALNISRSRDLIAVAGTVTSATGRVPAVAVSTHQAAWQVSTLDLGGRAPSQQAAAMQIGVSGTRIAVTAVAGPSPGSSSDTPLLFFGEGGAPFKSQIDNRFSGKGARLTVGSQYLWWVISALGTDGLPESTIFGPADPIGVVDYTDVNAGWQPLPRVAGEAEHIGGRDAGEEYFAISDRSAPSSVRSVIRGTTTILDDTIAGDAFGGRNWLRNCCLNAEPSVGVGPAGIVALAASEPLGLTPTPDLSKLAIALSSDGTSWQLESIGSLLPERDLDVTKLFVLDARIIVVVTDRYPQPDGTRDAIVLVGQLA